MSELEYVKCALCNEDKEVLLMEAKNIHGSHRLSDEKFNLVKCKDCELVYVNPRPAQNEIGRFYDKDYYSAGNLLKTYIEKVITHYSNLRKKILIKGYKQMGKILDIGCGTGDFLSSFNSDRWDLYGVEPSEEGFSLSINKVSGKIFNDNLINCKFADNYFDVISMWHVFEHLYYPNEQLQEIHRILKEDGILIIAVPNIKSLGFRLGRECWFHLDCPRHLYHYHSETMRRMLNKNGFQVLKISFPSFAFPLDLYHSLINILKNKLIRTLLLLPLVALSLLLKPISSLFKVSETMRIICGKRA